MDRKLFLDRDVVSYHFGEDVPPRLVVESGSVITIATHDARSGKLKTSEDVVATAPDFSAPGYPKTNPVTGPIGIVSAEPGDALAVTVLDIDLDPVGFIIARPEWGVVKNSVPHLVAKMLPVEAGSVVFSERLRVPLRPNIGTIGTAPAGTGIATINCAAHGGNMDCPTVTVGTTVHLPVRVNLGLLMLGDVHAAMGDGEPVGAGCEIGAKVTVRVELIKGGARDWPWMETFSHIVSYGAAQSFEAAATIAMGEMISMVQERLGLTYSEAFLLIGLAGDLRVNQACGSPINVSVRVEFPKSLEFQPLSVLT